MTKIEQLEQKIQDLERRLCCDKARFYSELSSFPSVGKEKVLYIDESTGDIYVWDGTQYTTADVLDKYHTHVVGTGVYNPLLPLTGWVAPSSPIEGNTVEVKFTDGTVGNYTFDGTVWGLDFANIKPKIYKALLTQSGTNDPVATVLENTLGRHIDWIRGSAGFYYATNFPQDKTLVSWLPYHLAGSKSDIRYNFEDMQIEIRTYSEDNNALADDMISDGDSFFKTMISIEVYP